MLQLQILGVLDHFFAFRQPHVGFLPITPVPFCTPPAPKLSMKVCSSHVVHFHFENALHGFFDLGLRSIRSDLEHHRVLRLFHRQSFLRDDRPANHLIEPCGHRLTLLPFGLGLGLFLLFSGRLLCRLGGCFRRRLGSLFAAPSHGLRLGGARRRFNLHGRLRLRS